MKRQRWYDVLDNSETVFRKLKILNKDTLNVLSQELVNVTISIKNMQREKNTAPLSLGINRVKGLYQSNKKRRWYDKSPYLNQAILSISTLPESEVINIFQGLDLSLSQYISEEV